MDRQDLAGMFLAKQGVQPSNRLFLAQDCSWRRYERVFFSDFSKGQIKTAVLMDAPLPESPERFVSVARVLRHLGLRAPQIYAQDLQEGFLLLEDFGDSTYNRLLSKGHEPRGLYETAIHVLLELHKRYKADFLPDLAPFDLSALLQEVALLTDWYYPAVHGHSLPLLEKEGVLALWREAFFPLEKTLLDGRVSLVLKDYHVDNLVYCPDQEGLKSCGLLDFQDALYGPMAYDVVSLLEDARRDMDPSLAGNLKELYLSRQDASFDRKAFDLEYILLGAQRAAKILGVFARLAFRDKKPHHLHHIPRVWAYLEAALASPFLAFLKKEIDLLFPASMRIIPSLELWKDGGSLFPVDNPL